MENNKVILFPLLKKGELNKSKEKIRQTDIEDLAEHYKQQLLLNLANHNLTVNRKFLQDFEVVREMIKSSIMRNLGKHHPLQDYVDEIITPTTEDK